MADPFTDVSVLNYNDDAPSDDGSEVPANRVNWAKVKDEIGDPLKTAVESLNTNTGAAVDKLVGGGGVTSSTAPYTVQASDQGKLVNITSSGTLTTATAATVGAPFVHMVRNASSGTLTVDGASSETVDGQSSITLPSGAGVTLFTNGSNWFTAGRGLAQDSSSYVTALPRGYLGGCQMSNDSDADHDIAIGAGVARDSSDSFNFELTSTLTKRIDASWASGDDAGGMASGVSLDTDTWYHVFLVDDGAGGTDAGFDTSITATNLLVTSGVGSYYRRIGSVLTDGAANILAFAQRGDVFLFSAPIQSITDTSDHTTAVLDTVHVPPGVSVPAILNVGVASSADGDGTLVSSPLIADTAPSKSATPGQTAAGNGTGNEYIYSGPIEIVTDTSQRVRYRAVSSAPDVMIITNGWIDRRGRDD